MAAILHWPASPPLQTGFRVAEDVSARTDLPRQKRPSRNCSIYSGWRANWHHRF
jgi:hypothetical protein